MKMIFILLVLFLSACQNTKNKQDISLTLAFSYCAKIDCDYFHVENAKIVFYKNELVQDSKTISELFSEE